MAYLVLGLSLVTGFALMGRWLLNTEPKVILRVARWVGLGLVAAIGLLILLRGRLDWLIYAVPMLLPVVIRWGGVMRTLRNAMKAARGPTPGQTSGVRTRYFAMSLDHDTGALDGEILEGRFAGQALSVLSAADRRTLLDEVRDDPASLQVLEAWLERAGETEDGSESGGRADPGDDGTVTWTQALDILGLSDGATEEEIREAHRRLMMVNHPDRGGSSWLAARINRAKDVLLNRP